MKIFRPLLFQLYLLQLENYKLVPYWRLAGFKLASDPLGKTQRQQVVWTLKAKMIFVLTLLLALIPAQALAVYSNGLAWQIALAAALVLFFANWLSTGLLSLAVLILWPLDWLIKQMIVARAKRKLAQFPKLKIIGVTGSFGKTTMKEFLASVLSEKFQVLKTPENINTPIGISRLIQKELSSNTEIFIVEMGAYQKGDIAELCRLTPPDIAILTGVNEAHLEKFGSMENTVEAKFEIVKLAKPDAVVVMNEDNALVQANYKKYVGSRKVLPYHNSETQPLGLNLPLLGTYVPAVLNACELIARHLGLSDVEIMNGMMKIKPIQHRLQVLENPNGVTVIDDSYNGNPDGVSEAVKALAKFKGRRRVFLTPGLVEMGVAAKQVHNKIGQDLAGAADLVILIRNSVTPFIAEGLGSNGYHAEQVVWFNTALEAHAALGQLLKPGDVVLFQNDWPDNYL